MDLTLVEEAVVYMKRKVNSEPHLIIYQCNLTFIIMRNSYPKTYINFLVKTTLALTTSVTSTTASITPAIFSSEEILNTSLSVQTESAVSNVSSIATNPRRYTRSSLYFD